MPPCQPSKPVARYIYIIGGGVAISLYTSKLPRMSATVHYRGFGKVRKLKSKRACTTCVREPGYRGKLEAVWEVELVTRPKDPDSATLICWWCDRHFKWWREYDRERKREFLGRVGSSI